MAKADPKKAEVKKPEVKKSGTEVATQLGGGAALILVQDQAPAHIQAGQRGSENVGTEDLVIPRLEVVQALSPAVTEGDAGFIKGAKVGDLINSVTNQNYGREVMVVPVHYSKQWLLWIKRTAGGGFRGAYPNPAEADDRMKAVVKEEPQMNGQIDVIDTPTHLCLIIDPIRGTVDEIIVSMPRTKAKVSRAWNSMIRLTGQDRFARVYRIGTETEKNAKGTFANFVVAQSGFPAKPLYERAEKLYNQVREGQRKVVMDTAGYDAGEGGGDGNDSEM